MALYLDNKVDPVAAQGKRQLDFLPKHFHCVALSNNFYDTKPIRNWIWKNQSGRFFIGSRTKVDDKHMLTESVVAFEDPGEAVMFTFILPTLNSTIFDDLI